MRRRVERERKKHMGVQDAPQKIVREVVIPEVITIQELANRMAERAVDVMKILMKMYELELSSQFQWSKLNHQWLAIIMR